MVNVIKGVLIETDSQMKALLVHLDETNALGSKFIQQDLDATHLFITLESVALLKARIDDLMDQINFVQEAN